MSKNFIHTEEAAAWFKKLELCYVYNENREAKALLEVMPDDVSTLVKVQGLFRDAIVAHRSHAGWVEMLLPFVSVAQSNLREADVMNMPLALFQKVIQSCPLEDLVSFVKQNEENLSIPGLEPKPELHQYASMYAKQQQEAKDLQLSTPIPSLRSSTPRI